MIKTAAARGMWLAILQRSEGLRYLTSGKASSRGPFPMTGGAGVLNFPDTYGIGSLPAPRARSARRAPALDILTRLPTFRK